MSSRTAQTGGPGTPRAVTPLALLITRTTVLAWFVFFCTMAGFYFIMSWTPRLLTAAGLAANQGLTGGILLNLGGIAGCALYAWAASRASARWLLTVALVATAMLIGAFGLAISDLNAALWTALLLGMIANGAMAGLYAVGPTLYPTAVRATGMGSAIGIGRFGAILAPILSGALLDRGWTPAHLYVLFAIPYVLAALAMLGIGAREPDRQPYSGDCAKPIVWHCEPRRVNSVSKRLRGSNMNSNPKLSCAITAILSTGAAGFTYAVPATKRYRGRVRGYPGDHGHRAASHGKHAGRADHHPGADRRNADATERLDLRRLREVSAERDSASSGSGPGRNLHARPERRRSWARQGAATIGTFPNVAVYLDEQSAQLPGRNLDVYAADLERIEVLEGPQGTLFGAGARPGCSATSRTNRSST